MRNGRNQERTSWSNDPKIDRQIKRRVMRNNVFAIIVVIIIIGSILFK